MSNKAKLGVFILIMAVAAVIVGLATSPAELTKDSDQPTTTASTSTESTTMPQDWQTYSNTQLDVTVSYPPNTSVQTEGPENRHIKLTYLGEDNATGEITDGFTVTISNYEKASDQTLRNFVENRLADNAAAQATSDIATTSFRNQTAVTYTTETVGTVNHTAFAPSEDRVIIISSNISDPNDNDYQQLVDQIISSTDFSAISDGNDQPANTVSEVTLVMLDRDIPEGAEPDRGCDQLAPITRSIESTQAPLTAAMEELFEINRTDVQGFHNFLAKTNSTLKFDRATVENGTANIYLTGQLSGVAGVCDNPRAAIQIEETAKQFSTVEEVELYLDGEATDLSPSGR